MDQIIETISDILLGAGALGAAVYCLILAKRLQRFNALENGVGGAVAVLSAQVDDMTRTLEDARTAAADSAQTLTDLTSRAEAAARKLELMMASLHDLPETHGVPKPGEQQDQSRRDIPVKDTAVQDEGAPESPMFATRRSARRELAA